MHDLYRGSREVPRRQQPEVVNFDETVRFRMFDQITQVVIHKQQGRSDSFDVRQNCDGSPCSCFRIRMSDSIHFDVIWG
jgi:hypothetical protein